MSLLIFTFLSAPLIAQPITRRGLAHPVVCRALLRAETPNSMDRSDRSPRVAIRDALYKLMKAFGIKTDAMFADIDGFSTPNFIGTHAPWEAMAHLRDLDADLYADNPKLSHVSFELRGRAEVETYLQKLEASANLVQSEVLKQKRLRYPRIRLATLIESLIPLGIAFEFVSQLQNGGWILALGAVIEAGVRLDPIKQRQFTLRKQLKFIRKKLGGEDPEDNRVALVSGSFAAEDRVEDSIRATAEASFPSLTTNLDYLLASLKFRAPQKMVHIFYDSLFFMDQTEPVWVVTYRAYHEPPQSRLHFHDEEDEIEPKPFSFGTRALQPIPVPVRNKNRN